VLKHLKPYHSRQEVAIGLEQIERGEILDEETVINHLTHDELSIQLGDRFATE
jgi:predicted transcriptional regulator